MSLLSEFFGNNTETMNTSVERLGAQVLRGAPVQPVHDFYEGFHYPYTPMQRTKRFPKIINAYALQERANADVQGFINHKTLIDNLDERIEIIERLLPLIENNENYEAGLKQIGNYLGSNLYRYIETRTGNTPTTISTGWNNAFNNFTQKSIIYPLQLTLTGYTYQNNLPYCVHSNIIRFGDGGSTKVDFNSPSNTTIIIRQIIFTFVALD